MSKVISMRRREEEAPAWRFFAWWDEALFTARLEAARTGHRMQVRKSKFWPTYWIVEEAGL